MKNLNTYILEELMILENSNGEIITEGFWKKLGSIFGYNTEKVAQTMQKWGDDLRNGFTTGQYIAAKSKDKEIKKAGEEMAKAAENGNEELYKKIFNKVEYFVKKVNTAADEMLFPFMNHYQLLKDLSNELNKDDGKQLAEKFKKLIDEKWPDGGKEYEKISLKIEKAGVDEGPKDEKSNTNDKGNDEVKKEIKQETTETITDNKDLLTPLAKEAGVDGKTLRNFVGTQLRKTLGEDQEKIKKKGTREAVQKALGENVILGTCVMVLGALITKDDTKIQEICKQLQTTSEELKNKLQNYK